MAKVTIATHDAKFHTDDVFAIATLMFVYPDATIVRTRNPELIEKADIVVDVGGVYDNAKKRFDHHQLGGAGDRPNGIPYASFGLVWRDLGENLSGSKDVADEIERILVESIDAADNGKNTFALLIPDIFPFDINAAVNLYRATWKEEGDWDNRFMNCVSWAQSVLTRLIKVYRDLNDGKHLISTAYEKSFDKRIIEIDESLNLGRELVMAVLTNFKEPIYAILYRADVNNWQVLAIRKDTGTYESRKPLPLEWRAKHDKELEGASGVTGAVFCHRSGFMCLANSKEGAIALAKKALEA